MQLSEFCFILSILKCFYAYRVYFFFKLKMISISDETNLKRACVMKRNQKYYFPKTIPRERGSMVIVYIAIVLVIFAVHFCISPDWSVLPRLYASITLFYFALCTLHRLTLFIFELKHSCSRYEDDYRRIFKAAFYFKARTFIFMLLCIVYLVYDTRHGFPSYQDKYWFLTIPFLFYLHRLVDLDNFPINDSLRIAKDDGLNYGSGMAYSFFYGYLNYMLDKIGEPNKNLREMMEDYESQNNIKFDVYKIFILIPKSLECFSSIKNVSNLMDMRTTLKEKQITVAGVRDRVYKNSVYTITHPTENRPVYVCAEYATPLKTFKEVVKHSTAHTEHYNRHKNDILLQFYLTLKQILEHNNMHMMCELVYYEDMDERNNFHDVGRILLTQITEITKREKPKAE